MPRRKYPHSDWEHLDQKELVKFYEEIVELAKQRFGVDYDGDCPVRLRLVDRSRCEQDHWWAVPYEHKAKTEQDRQSIENAIINNLDIAMENMKRWNRLKQLKDKDAER